MSSLQSFDSNIRKTYGHKVAILYVVTANPRALLSGGRVPMIRTMHILLIYIAIRSCASADDSLGMFMSCCVLSENLCELGRAGRPGHRRGHTALIRPQGLVTGSGFLPSRIRSRAVFTITLMGTKSCS